MEGNNMVLFGLAILISVVVNVVITVIMHSLNSNQRTLKNIKDSIKVHRDEVAASSNRIREESLQAEARVSAVCKDGEETIARVIEALESIATYQQDLNALSNTCVSYHNSLEKLRTATEQAEARIQYVQEEVRQIESVGSFVERTEADFNRLSSQLQSTRAEYVKLVTATEADLRAKAEAQKNENQDMLQTIVVEMEGFRSSFETFVAGQRSEFSAFAYSELEKAREEAEHAEEARKAIEAQVSGMQDTLRESREALDKAAGELEERNAEIKEQAEKARLAAKASVEESRLTMEENLAELDRRREETSTAVADDIQAKLLDADKEISARKDALLEASGEITGEATAAVDGLRGEVPAALDSFRSELTALKDGFSSEVTEILQKAGADVSDMTEDLRKTVTGTLDEAEISVREKETRIRDTLQKAMADADAKAGDLRKSSSSTLDAMESAAQEKEARVRAVLDKAAADAEGKAADLRAASSDAHEAAGSAVKDMEERAQAIIEEVMDKVRAGEDALKCLVSDTGAEVDGICGKVKAVASEAADNIASCRSVLDQSLSSFTSTANGLIAQSFDSMNSGLDRRWKKLNEQLESFQKALDGAVSDTRETVLALSDKESISIREAVSKLNELDSKIKDSDEKLRSISQAVTDMREELFNTQLDKQRLEKQIEDRNQELLSLQGYINAQGEERLKSEAALLRLKSEIRSKEKSLGKADPETARERRFEDMIEEFPDEFLSGSGFPDQV